MREIYSILLLCLSIFIRVNEGCSCESPMWIEHAQENHPCDRRCVEGETMTCHFTFDVEIYYSMSKACYNCSLNITDCYRPDCVALDGFSKVIYTANKRIPGPTLRVCEGDKLIITINNKMNDETTSIHWHGMLQQGTPYMDGVPMVTQCPIAPGTTFKYEYWANDWGTHFWHGHIGVHRTDGLFGAIVVKQPDSKNLIANLYDFDEHLLVFNDWSHLNAAEKLMIFEHKGGPNTNAADTILVNGRGRYYNDTVRMSDTPLAVFTVRQGYRYRFRMVGAGSFACPIAVSIDDHKLISVSGDGSDFTPTEVDSMVLYQGERWDFILHAYQEVGTYWIRMIGHEACVATKAHGMAILKYEGADCKEPTAPLGYDKGPEPKLELNSVNVGRNEIGSVNIPSLNALYKSTEDWKGCNPLKEKPDIVIHLKFDFNTLDNPSYHKHGLYGYYQVNSTMRTFTPQFNHASFKPPNVPPLSQPCDIDTTNFCDHTDHKRCVKEYCECTNMYEIEFGSVVEMVLVNEGAVLDATHPFHLHGYSFRVVAMDKLGKSTTAEAVRKLDEEGKIKRNLEDAPYKDTVTVPDGGYTILRFCATNPGVWFFHCHLEFHLETKMALMIKVGHVEDYPPVPRGFPQCGNYYNDEQPSCLKSNKKSSFQTLLSHIERNRY